MSEMQEPVEGVKKKKRKYTRRGPYKITVDGKSFQGLEIRRDGKFLVLKTAKGSVMVNVETARTPIEIIGEVAIRSLPNAEPTPGAPAISGGAAEFAARRRASVDNLLSMPGGFESPDE